MEAGAALGFAQAAGFSSKIPDSTGRKADWLSRAKHLPLKTYLRSNVLWTQGLYLGIYMYIYVQ